ncbi:MAG TPA: ABC transporter permease [Streptosporangiaceae bacterium]|nr:ABC transporter permease [Streptosporangiaceae bacterium]
MRTRFALRRFAEMILTLLVASFVIFGCMYLAPGNPVSFLLSGRAANPANMQVLDAEYHLNEPFIEQYARWLGQVLHGNLGRSIEYRSSVDSLLAQRLPNTLLLVAMSLVIVLVAGLALGWLSAIRGGRTDGTILVATTVAVGTPSFVAAIILQAIFAVKLGWLPAGGTGTGFPQLAEHLILPAIALSLYLIGLLARVTRSAMLEVMEEEHVTVARSRGVPERTVVWRHVFRNSLVTVLTMSGLIISTLVVCTVLVEDAFSVNGIGSLLDLSTTTKDFPVVQAISLIFITGFMVVNFAVDLLLPVVDPRVTLGERNDAA